MRVLAYGVSSDVVDEYLRMSGTTTRKALLHFVDGVISCFGETYLRRPNQQDLARLLYVGEQRGFPDMIGSIDCMHRGWKNCPTAWAGQYTGRGASPTIILEAVAAYDLWIWHTFFGTLGLCNDINVLHQSPVFSDVLEGRSPKVNYIVNGRQNDGAYYLTGDIYPSSQLLLHRPKNTGYLLNTKSLPEKMLREPLEFCKLVSRFSMSMSHLGQGCDGKNNDDMYHFAQYDSIR